MSEPASFPFRSGTTIGGGFSPANAPIPLLGLGSGDGFLPCLPDTSNHHSAGVSPFPSRPVVDIPHICAHACVWFVRDYPASYLGLPRDRLDRDDLRGGSDRRFRPSLSPAASHGIETGMSLDPPVHDLEASSASGTDHRVPRDRRNRGVSVDRLPLGIGLASPSTNASGRNPLRT